MMAVSPETALKRLAAAPWLRDPAVKKLFETLDGKTGRTRAVGGIVRNSLLGLGPTDIDFATELTPDEVIGRAADARIGAHPTGIDHGTVTLVIADQAFQVTTLRQDVATDGRRATVRFGTDWARDASRRDFTMNALYCSGAGELFDPLGGLSDCLTGTVQFIGQPAHRIAEDYLRILRFFRFFALFGAGRPDAAALKACTKLKPGLASLSAERVWQELKRLLAAPDPARALLWMRTTGVLAQVLPEGEKWGIDAIHPLPATEKRQGWPPDPLLRLMAIMPPMTERIEALAKRLKLSGAEHRRLANWANARLPEFGAPMPALDRVLYAGGTSGVADRLKLALAGIFSSQTNKNRPDPGVVSALLAHVEAYERPRFPVSGNDLIAKGYAPGEALGTELGRLEEIWVQGGFAADREQLVNRIRPPAQNET
jgi:poly(A) polymerase